MSNRLHIPPIIGEVRDGQRVEISREFLLQLNDIFNGKRDNSIGTILSGVNQNSDDIDTLTTEVTAARDGETTLFAKVQNIDQAIVDEGSARATAISTLQSEVDDNTASITNIAEAYATDNGSTARLVWEVNTGTNVASITQTAASGFDDGTWNGSAIEITASDITLDGDVVITGTLTTEKLEANAVTNRQVSQTAGAISLSVDTWTDVASFSFTSEGIGVELQATADFDISVNVSAAGTGPVFAQLRLLRDSTVLRTSQAIRETSSSSGIETINVTQSMNHNDIPSSGTYTYKLQARFATTTGTPSGANILSDDVSGRSLMAVEYKR